MSEVSLSEQSCISCLFHKTVYEHQSQYGICCRHAPIALDDGSTEYPYREHTRAAFPTAPGWCGDWQQRVVVK